MEGPIRSCTRALLLLVVRYLQVITIFACFYVGVQHFAQTSLYTIQGVACLLRPAEAFYFSLVTGSTVGFGDISPNISAAQDLKMWARPSR
jgi:hypothetical protein